MLKKILAAAVAVSGIALAGCAQGPFAATNYMSWDEQTWDAATGYERNQAAQAVLSDVGNDMMSGYDKMVADAKHDAAAQANVSRMTAQMVGEIGTYFDAKSGATLQDLVDQTRDLFGTD